MSRLLIPLIAVSILGFGQIPNGFSQVDFESTAAELFTRKCIECHNPIDASGELDLTQSVPALRGGASGPAMEPGNASHSLLVQRVLAGEMPPEKNGKAQHLSTDEIASLQTWINEGAKWPEGRILDPYDRSSAVRAGRDWWSLQPLQTHPSFKTEEAIDQMIQSKLAALGMEPAPPADRRTLLRRLYFDLIGLPPTAEEVEAFVADQSPDAYEQRVDQLLAMPQFGERWARHWLDVVRYADTNGYERDAEKPNAWRYRDWVVSSIHSDMPYDRFITEQLAGDELPDRTDSSVIATGFIRLGTWDDEPNDPAEYQYDRLEDMVHATSTAFLGLTVKCARCHDHKFDPIYQSDYYRIGSAFWAGPVAHRDRALNGGPSKEELGSDFLGWTDITKTPSALYSLKKGDIHRPIQAVAAGPLSCFPKLNRPFEDAPGEARTTRRRLQLAQWIGHPENPLTARVAVNRLWQHHFGEGLVRTSDNFGFNGQRPTHPELLDWLAKELIDGQWRLKRIHKLMVMSNTYRQSSKHPLQSEYASTDSSNQWLWRANRQRLDAEALRDAILATSGQLDRTIGGPSFRAPINSEALEGLSMKGNAYVASDPKDARRRSLYMFQKRSLMVPMMTAFDQCDSTVPNSRRDSTIVPTQALAMLNNDWVHEQSRAFAERVMATSPDVDLRIDTAWQLAFARTPTQSERLNAKSQVYHQAMNAMQSQSSNEAQPKMDGFTIGWISLCHVLLNTNEFITVD
jgi:hypothetical protein